MNEQGSHGLEPFKANGAALRDQYFNSEVAATEKNQSAEGRFFCMEKHHSAPSACSMHSVPNPFCQVQELAWDAL